MSGIRVICRLRPQNKVEQEAGGGNCVEFSETTIKIQTHERTDESARHEFTFDRICGPECPQAEVFEVAARPVVTGVLDGYNGTIFAYGQTGSGKTFTMEGPDIYDPLAKGIIPRMMDALFEGLVQASETCEFTLKCSFLEIYLERIQDLLDNSKSNLQLKEDKTRGIYVQDASEIYVGSPAEMISVMNTGASNRSVAATRMNARSSRSHSIFCVHVDQRDTESGSRKSGRLYFVDLAGSEKIAKTNVTGKQLEEAKMINKSLSALGNVINALTDKNVTFVPYRDSKLTRMLQESLGGNSQTTLVIACSMNSYNDRETLSTLRFGLRAKKIQNKPIVNQERSAKELLKQLEQAKKEISTQSEIITNLKTHIQTNYADHLQLVREVTGIIDQSFSVASPSSKHESEHSLFLLKQHTEIVSLNEELQKVRLEKQELEDELNYRTNDISEYESQLQDLNAQLNYEQDIHNQTLEELQAKLELALFKHQQQYLDAKKLRTTIERLRKDVLIVHSEVPENTRWLRILQQSMEDALATLNSLAESAEAYSSEPTLGECEASTERGTNTEASFLFAAEEPRSDLKALVFEQRSTIDSLQQDNSRLQADFEHSEAALLLSQQESMHLVEEMSEINSKLKETMEYCVVLEKQLELKVRNIEEERETINLELQAKDYEIEELRNLLGHNARKELITTPKGVDVEMRINKLCDERQELYEELVKLRKMLDQRDEQLHNALQRNRRLERQLAIKQTHPTSPSARILSPRSRLGLQDPQFFNKRVMKPIRGGGGDLWNFQHRNQRFAPAGPADSVIRNKEKIERLAHRNKSGLGSMVKEIFSGLWS